MKKNFVWLAMLAILPVGKVYADGQEGHAAHRTMPVPHFSIASDQLEKVRVNDPDRLVPEEEHKLLRYALKDTFAALPAHLQDIAGKAGYIINHSDEGITKVFMGMSAEDDAYYRYPDRKFFNPDLTAADANPQGTIRVNVTEKFIKALQLGLRLGEKDAGAMEGIRNFYRQVITHELTHAYQYYTHPVKDFSRFPGAIRDGLADEAVLRDAKQKVEYEHDAFAAQRNVADRAAIEKLAKAMSEFAKNNPALFEQGGEFQLLSDARRNPFIKRYLLEDSVLGKEAGREFAPKADLIYNGEVVPAEVVVRLKKLNDSLEGHQPSNQRLAQARKEATSLVALWQKYMSSENLEILRGAFRYTRQVEDRYRAELARFKSLAR